jgi:Protein of unknown function (DUF3027)
VSPNRARSKEPDELCAQAVDLARAAADEVAGPDQVGPPAGCEADGDRVVTHLFTCLAPAYAGWRWAVTVTRAARSKAVTVSECLLLPGPDSLLAPEWVPWSDRVRPGDLGVGDLLPTSSDDERLVPVAVLEGDEGMLDWDVGPESESPGWLAGHEGAVRQRGEGAAPAEDEPLGRRRRVLSALGRDAAAERWYSGERGPAAPRAHAAPGPCATCGFLVALSGPLGRAFGVCANEFAPDDGSVVALDHGCGAHSEAATMALAGRPEPALDRPGYDLVDAAGVSLADTAFEPLDRGAG